MKGEEDSIRFAPHFSEEALAAMYGTIERASGIFTKLELWPTQKEE